MNPLKPNIKMDTEKTPYSGETIPILKMASSEKAFAIENGIDQSRLNKK